MIFRLETCTFFTAEGEGQVTDQDLKAIRKTSPKDQEIWATAVKKVDDMSLKAPGLTLVIPDFGAKETEIKRLANGFFEVKGFIVIASLIVAAAVGAILLFTAATGFCLLYRAIGIDTSK